MLNWLPRTISARHLQTIVLVLIAGSLMSFAFGQSVAHGARSGSRAVGERIHGWVMSAPQEAAVNHPSKSVAVVSHTTASTAHHESGHHHKHHGDNQGGGGDGGGGGGGD